MGFRNISAIVAVASARIHGVRSIAAGAESQVQSGEVGATARAKKTRGRRYILIAAIALAVIVAGVLLYTYFSSQRSTATPGLSAPSAGKTISSGPFQVSSISVEKTDICFKALLSQVSFGGTTCRTYGVAAVKSGLQGYLVRFRLSNIGSETYVVTFVLITSKGRQLGLLPALQGGDIGVDITLGVSDCYASEEQKVLLNRCTEIPQETFNILAYSTITSLSPGASVDVKLLYGLQPDEKPAKIHVIARSISGTTHEFDIPLP